jgi:hypothetical protein
MLARATMLAALLQAADRGVAQQFTTLVNHTRQQQQNQKRHHHHHHHHQQMDAVVLKPAVQRQLCYMLDLGLAAQQTYSSFDWQEPRGSRSSSYFDYSSSRQRPGGQDAHPLAIKVEQASQALQLQAKEIMQLKAENRKLLQVGG